MITIAARVHIDEIGVFALSDYSKAFDGVRHDVLLEKIRFIMQLKPTVFRLAKDPEAIGLWANQIGFYGSKSQAMVIEGRFITETVEFCQVHSKSDT